MSTVVVYESMFGNTEEIAKAIAAGLRPSADVIVLEVSDAPRQVGGDVDLLVVGGPTHAFGMTRRSTREDAGKQADGQIVSRGGGIREWLMSLPGGRSGPPVATFDTRIEKVRRLPGSAARGAARLLHRRGYRMIAPPQSFYVTDVSGPLAEGELERARRWGKELASALTYPDHRLSGEK